MIDLHLHTTESDGMLAPADLVRAAGEAGLTAVAITDHDTTAALPAAAAAGAEAGLEVVPGVEVSVEHGPGTFHLIGLFIDPDEPGLAAALARIREGRADRNERLANRLAELNLPVSVEEAAEHAGGDLVARPHFAATMVARGYVRSVREAFDLWIGKGRPGYVERYRPEPAEAIDLVHDAGGVAVLCHPHTLGVTNGLDAFVGGLAELGLDAMETRYKEPDPAREARFGEIAARHGLLESGGSDYHGHTLADQRFGLGAVALEPDALERLRARADEVRSRGGR